MDIKKIRYFISIAEWKNFTVAADKNYISQSALSKNISDLEYELGVKLFTRSKTSVSLTAEGEALLPVAQEILRTEETFYQQARALSERRMVVMRIGYFGYWEYAFVCEAIRIFSNSNPYVTLEFNQEHHGRLNHQLRQGVYDVVFTLDKKQAPGEIYPNIGWMPIAESPLYVFVSENHHLASKKSLTLKELENEQQIVVSRSKDSVFNAIVSSAFLNAGVECSYYPIVPLTSRDMLLHVIANQGINFSTHWWKLEKLPGIKVIPLDADIPMLEFGVAYRLDRNERIIHSFLSCVKQVPDDKLQQESNEDL